MGNSDADDPKEQSSSPSNVSSLPLNTTIAALSNQGTEQASASHPYMDTYQRSIFTPYGTAMCPPYNTARQKIHFQFMGGIHQPGVPLPCEPVEEPVFVNAKQYHGILRRRQSRAKLESENKIAKSRKPYLHESRHLHALRRERGCGGRFLNSKKKEGEAESENEHRPRNEINLNSHKSDFQSS